ncbi:MAG: hypothetical protein GEV12_10095 [Micromonosporaceae bacterium]|nr:hypothetical protein [Micromonosporaceae bacterium]
MATAATGAGTRRPGDPAGWPGPPARLPDPARRPEPAEHGGAWLDLLPGYRADSSGRDALTEPTQILPRPLMTRGQQWRGNGGRRPGGAR